MIRKIIKIDEEKCNGCGLCASACHENAIGMVNGKAKLLRDDYCDGLGNCLPVCPTGAITFEEREADEYNGVGAPGAENSAEHAAAMAGCRENAQPVRPMGGCPGTRSRQIVRQPQEQHVQSAGEQSESTSQLNQWPVQIKLVPINAPYFNNAHLLIAADCTAYAYGGFHSKFMKNKVTLIGCPKLDEGDYSEKLAAILQANNIKSVTVVRMEVPCCGGVVHAVTNALQASGKMIPWQVVTISTDGQIIEE